MQNAAMVLHRRVRFRSLVNNRVFSFLDEGNRYELLELENNDENPLVKEVLYQGNDALKVMNVILKEVNHVQ